MTTPRGRHRKLRRNILQTVIATALLAGTFTVVDQTLSSQTSPANANTAGGSDTTWNSAVNTNGAPTASVADTLIDSSGNIFVASGTVVRKYSATGSLVWTSNPVITGTTGTVTAMAFGATGKIIVGTTNSIGLLTDSGSNVTWTPWDTWKNIEIYAVAYVSSASQYYVAMNNSTASNRIGGFGLAGNFAQNFNGLGLTATQYVYDLDVDSSGTLHVVGNFSDRYAKFANGGSTRVVHTNITSALGTSGATRLDVRGTGASQIVAFGGSSAMGRVRVFSTATTAGAEVNSLAMASTVASDITTDLALGSSDIAFDSSGRLLVGGATFGLKRIKTDGTLDSNFTTTIPGTVRAISVHGASPSDHAGKIVVGMSVSPWIQRLTPENVAPATPPAPTAVASDRQATVTVAAALGPTPTGYTVTASPGGATCTVTGASGNCTITGLTNGTAYTFTAVARNGDTSSAASVASNSVTPTRIVPTFVSATNTTAGNTIVLNYDIDLLASPLPTASMFTVQEAGVTKTVSSVAVSGKTVTLTLSAAVQRGATVTVAYQAPATVDDSTTTAAIQGTTGTDALSLAATALTTNSSTYDTQGPVFVSGTVNATGTAVIVTFDESLVSNTTWHNFAITKNGVDIGTAPINDPTVSGSRLTIPITTMTFEASDIVTLTYKAANSRTIRDSLGNTATYFTGRLLTNASTIDTVSPNWTSATTNSSGDEVTLTFNENLSSNLSPLASAFSIATSDGTTPTVSATSVTGSTVVLTLSAPIQSGSTVTFSYTAPNASLKNGVGNAAIQDIAGNDVATLTTKAVTNASTYDTLGPVLSTLASRTVSADGQTLTLTFNEAIGSTAALTSAFTVTAAGSSVPVSGVAVSGSTVVLTLGSIVQTGHSVTVTYTAPTVDSDTGNSAVQDLLGNDTLTFTNQAVTNSSTMDTVAPVFTSASVDSAGTLLTLIYGENPTSAAGSVPSSSQYTVTADGTAVTVTNAVVSGNSIRLTLGTAINGGQSVSVSYLAPTPATNTTGNAAVQDAAGNDSVSLTSASVTNGSTAGPPAFYEIIVQPNGTEIWVVFNKQLTATSPASSLSLFANGTTITCTGNPGNGWYSGLPYYNYQCSPKITAGMTVTATYTKPASGNVYGNASGATASKSGIAVTNNSTQAPDTTPPTLSSAVIDSAGNTLTLTYNETLSAVTASASSFTVTVAGNPVTVTGVSRSGSAILLTLGTVVNATDVVTIEYVAPTPDTSGSNGAIQDGSGNDAGSIANTFAVTNSSTQGPFLVTGGTVAASGTSVSLTFSKPMGSYSMSGVPFTIYANGAAIKCSGFSTPTLSGCSPTIPTGAEITASFVPTAGLVYTSGSESLQAASGVSLVNNSTQPADVTAPNLTSITMPGTNGQTIVLTYDETMGGVVPTSDMFTIMVDGTPSTVSSVSVSGQQLTLTMSPPIELGQTVSVAYAPPSPANSWGDVAAIQDVYGNDAGAIATTSVPNTSTAVVDRAVPVLQSAATNSNGTQIILTYNETINSKTATPTDFAITLNGMTFSPTAVSISGSTVVLTVGTTVVSGESVSVAYTAPTPSGLTSNSAIQDLSGNDAASLSNTTVTNNSNGLPDLTPPTVSTVAYSGTQVTLTLNEPLSSTTAGAGQYTVFVGNTPVTPSAVTISGQTVVLTLPSSIPAGTVVAVSYTAPLPAVSNTSNQALQDLRGNDAASFNVSTQPTSSSWEWVGGTPTGGCPSGGGAYVNSTKSKLLPNGVTYTVAVTGDNLCIAEATESLSQRGGRAGDFTSTGLVTEPGLMLWTSNDGCISGVLCENRGVMTVSFSKPVTNPIVSFAGWGGGSDGASWSEMKLLTTGATVTALSGTNIQISQDGTYIENIDGKIPTTKCHDLSNGFGGNAGAVCGSLQINGTYTSVSFQVNQSNFGGVGYEDAWNLTASIPEDFGLVPTTYDTPVASHAIGNLKLGAVVTADQASSLYATTNADAVASGTEIKAGAKNVSNGDVVIDDGVAQTEWNGLVDNRDGETFEIDVSLAGVTETANLCAWIDFNRDGVFTAGERACATSPTVGQTSAKISWTIPNDIVSGPTYARVRLSYDALALPSGKVGSGEVEDYSLTIASSAIPSAVTDNSIGGKDVNQTISPLVNDQFQQGFGNDMTKMFLCLPNQTPMNCTVGVGQPLTIAGEGTYTLNADGTVTFDPVSTFTGTATPIKYQIADTSGRTSSSTINPVVIPTPIGVQDTSSGEYDKDQIINPLTNDVPGSRNYPIVGSTLKLCQVDDPTTAGVNEEQSPNSCNATSVTIPGEGTYTLNSDGTVTFNPLSTFYGTVATPVKYQAQDTLGQFENSTIRPTVAEPPAVIATNDTSSGNYDINQTIQPLRNDVSDGNEQTLLPETLMLCQVDDPATTGTNEAQSPNNCTATSVTIPGEGTYTVNSDGTVTFNPLPTFTGTVATPVVYQVTDALGRKVSANITPTVGLPPIPTALPENTSGPFNTAQSTTPLENETPGSVSFPLSKTDFKLCEITESPNDCSATSVTISGEGTYTYNATTGKITFTPLATFVGEATPIVYQTKDSLGRFVNSTYTPDVDMPPPPAADDETSTGAFNTPQAPIDVLLGDTPGNSSAPLDPDTLRLCDPSTTPPQTGATCTETSVTTDDGTYEIVDGKVVFTPANNFHGVATPIDYIVEDSLGQIAQGTITPTVNKPTPPTADPETKSVLPGQSVSFTTITGANGLASGTQLQTTGANKTCLFTPNTTICDADNSITIVGEGTYTLDPTTGVVTFAADANATSAPKTPITYRVTDVTGQSATDTLTPIIPPPPAADDETSTGAFNTPQAPIDVLLGDTPGNSSAPLDPDTLRLCNPSTTPPQTGATCTETSVTTADGTYEIVDGKVVFTPANNFHGVATPIDYIVEDSLGQIAQGTITPTVNKPTPPTADPETKSVLPGQSVSFTTTTGTNGLAEGTELQTNGANKTCLFTPNTTTCDADGVITIAGEGTYTLDPATGIVTFAADPNATSGAKTPITYRVTDVTGQSATDTLTPIIPPPPAADDETDTVPFNTAKQIDVLNGDTPGDPSAPLDPSSLKLCGANESSPNCTKDEVTVPEGTYRIVNGKVEFTPNTNFSGPVTPIDYIVEDSLGQFAQGTITLSVPIPPAPTANPDVTSGPWNTPQSINVVDNASGNTGDDVAGTGATLIPSSVVLSCGAAANCTTATVNGKIEVTIANQGTYSLGSNGEVIFTPLPTFKNTATPVTYTVSDNSGQTATTAYTPTVVPPPAPMADPETTSGIKGATQTIDLIPGDTTFDPAITLVRASVALSCKSGVANCSVANNKVTIVGVGTYEIDPANPGHMLFTPEPNFTGVGPAVNYTVTDSMGGTASSTYTPTVIPPPTVVSDTTSAGWNVTQSINVVTSTAGADTTNTKTNSQDTVSPLTSWKPNSITIDCANEANCTETVVNGVVTEVIMAGQGKYTVDPQSNVITFVPVDTFTGIARPVTYSISDARDQVSSTTYTPTVIAPPVPTATPDTVELIPGQSKVFSSIFDGQTGDTDPALATKGAGAPDLTNSTVCIIDPATSVCDTDGIVTIAGQGTYTLNPTTGIVTYEALSSATPGAKTPVTYKITDGLGRSVTNTLTPTITPPPVANPDFSTGVQGAIQTLSPVGNDRPGGGASTELFPDTRAQIPSGVFLCSASQPPPDCAASSVIVNDANNVKLGVLTVAASGLVTFTPEPNFIGTTPPIGYQIPDNLGQKAYSTITITVVPPPAPSATIDTGSSEYNKAVTLRPWINDSAGSVPAGSSAPAPNLVATSIKLCDDNATFVAMSGAPADCTATKVQTVEGIYEVSPTTGEVIFTPNPNMIDPITGLATGMGFVGTVKYPPTYQIWNNWTGAGGAKSATALLVPTIAPPGAPAATEDVTKTKPGTSVILDPVKNDKPGTAALDPTSIRLCGADEISPSCTQMSVTTLDGTYVVEPTTGQVTFTPRDGFIGKATIPYVIMDGLGMMANANLIITVEDTAVVPVVKKKTGLAKTGGARPDLLLLLGLVALAGAGGLRFASRKTK